MAYASDKRGMARGTPPMILNLIWDIASDCGPEIDGQFLSAGERRLMEYQRRAKQIIVETEHSNG
jgi:hypothetical protein